MSALICLVLSAAPSPPSSAYLNIRNQGADAGWARSLNCSGSGVSCSVDPSTNFAMLVVTASGDGGPGLTLPLCDAGYVLTSDGGSLSCVSSILTSIAAAPGSPVGSIQYNGDAGGFGGVTNVTTNGADFTILPETSSRPVPSSGRTFYDKTYTSGMPPLPVAVESFFASEMPGDFFTSAPAYSGGTSGMWTVRCHLPDTYGANSLSVLYGTSAAMSAAASTGGYGGFDAGTLVGREKWLNLAESANNTANGVADNTSGSGPMWLGNSSGAGGFLAWTRWANFVQNNDPSQYIMVGWGNGLVVPASGGTEPNSLPNVFYFGCNSGDSDVFACVNGKTDGGAATCNDLGVSFPCRTPIAAFDGWFWAAPNAASINYYVVRLDTGDTANGSLSSNLPSGALKLNAAGWMNAGHDAGGSHSSVYGLGGFCEWDHL